MFKLPHIAIISFFFLNKIAPWSRSQNIPPHWSKAFPTEAKCGLLWSLTASYYFILPSSSLVIQQWFTWHSWNCVFSPLFFFKMSHSMQIVEPLHFPFLWQFWCCGQGKNSLQKICHRLCFIAWSSVSALPSVPSVPLSTDLSYLRPFWSEILANSKLESSLVTAE